MVDGINYFRLLAGDDPGKEQSYFLCQLNQLQLKKTLFPIGHLTKTEVRDIARKAKLPSAEKKDSQGICFVGKVDLPTFLQQKLEAKEGDIIEIPAGLKMYSEKSNASSLVELSIPWTYAKNDGDLVGKHRGAHFFTIGQRKGLNVGGKEKPLFVIATDIDRNIVYTGQGQDHPGLYRKALKVNRSEIHWIRPDKVMSQDEEREYMLRIRYRQPLQKARIFMKEDGMYILFDKPQRGIAAGQFAAWYEKGELMGSGVISD